MYYHKRDKQTVNQIVMTIKQYSDQILNTIWNNRPVALVLTKQFRGLILQRFLGLIKWLKTSLIDSPHPIPKPSVLDGLRQARREFFWAQNYYSFVSDTNLIDYAIYQMLAAESKYVYFLKKARSEGIVQDLETSPIGGVFLIPNTLRQIRT